MANLTIHKGDNFAFVEDGTVDFILTDPPFNISKKTNFHTYEKNSIHSYQFDGESEEAWDTYTHEEFIEKLNEWATEWARVLRKGGNFAIFCADAYISHLMEALKNAKLSPRRLITWRKNNAVPINRAYMPMSANEYIIVGVKPGKNTVFNADIPIVEQTVEDKLIEATIVADKASTIIYTKIREALQDNDTEGYTEDEHLNLVAETVETVLQQSKEEILAKTVAMYKTNKQGEKYLQACVPNYIQNPLKTGNRLHPTEKPVPLLKYLTALYSNAGDTVLDSFGGSGSTGEAALQLGRNAVIIERDPDFYQKLSDRLSPQADETKKV